MIEVINKMPKKSVEKKLEEKKKQRVYDLFDNPMVRSALESMTPEQVESYKRIGKEMYGTIDFEKSEVLSNLPPPMAEALLYIEEGLKSGLHPTDLSKDEIALLVESYGKEWYKKWNWSEQDL